MTAVNWLIEQIKNDQNQKALTGLEWMKVIEQAKEMEKQMIIDAATWGTLSESADHYYKDKYGSKGSDGNFKQFSLYEHKETITSADTITSSQTEISDEEIREQGIKYDNQALSETPIAHFMEGAFWYREQLKNKQ